MTEAYPLQWPVNKQKIGNPQQSRFDTSFTNARDGLVRELELLNAKHATLSTNIEIRLDGLPYAGRKQPDDRGVAVYFQFKGKSMCFACDKWDKVGDNIHAISKTINAIRGIERWGSDDMLRAAFTGFEALPAPKNQEWWRVLGVNRDASKEIVKKAYHDKAKIIHPDNGGSTKQMIEINQAYKEFKEKI